MYRYVKGWMLPNPSGKDVILLFSADKWLNFFMMTCMFSGSPFSLLWLTESLLMFVSNVRLLGAFGRLVISFLSMFLVNSVYVLRFVCLFVCFYLLIYSEYIDFSLYTESGMLWRLLLLIPRLFKEDKDPISFGKNKSLLWQRFLYLPKKNKMLMMRTFFGFFK